MIITIHQPNFVPWYPFFQKMEMADVFVFLTHCQYRKNYFQNRFNIGDTWHTMSVSKKVANMTDKQYMNPEKDWNRIKSNLPAYADILVLFDDCISDDLVETNTSIIIKIAELLKFDVEFQFDYKTELTSNERLIDLCLNFGADTYIAGTGSSDYMEVDLFEDNGISVEFQKEDDKIQKPILEILSESL